MKNSICQIKECNKKVIARGWCGMHYKRWQIHGDPNILMFPQHYHGMSDTPEYRIWRHIIDRCNNPKNARYSDYGGRGIGIGFATFQDFIDEIGVRPADNLTVDRIDNNKGYEKGNIRWATCAEQNRNKRIYKNNRLGIRGVRVSRYGNYIARISTGNGRQRTIGTFKTIQEAQSAINESLAMGV